MGFWKDPVRKDWMYKFQFRGNGYGGRGFKTRREAEIARAEHRKQIEKSSV